MEKLERTLEKALIESRREETKPVIEDTTLYQGFRLVEDKVYEGPIDVDGTFTYHPQDWKFLFWGLNEFFFCFNRKYSWFYRRF